MASIVQTKVAAADILHTGTKHGGGELNIEKIRQLSHCCWAIVSTREGGCTFFSLLLIPSSPRASQLTSDKGV